MDCFLFDKVLRYERTKPRLNETGIEMYFVLYDSIPYRSNSELKAYYK